MQSIEYKVFLPPVSMCSSIRLLGGVDGFDLCFGVFIGGKHDVIIIMEMVCTIIVLPTSQCMSPKQ